MHISRASNITDQPTSRRTRRTIAILTAAALVVALAACDIPPESPPAAKGYAGKCTGADALSGTTMVVDFQALDGLNGTAAPDIVRCSPNPSGAARTGIRALQDAGIGFTGTTRWGFAFMCRINQRPSATEPLPIAGSPGYKESCANTPPAAASWSYWWASGGGTTWTYTTIGALNRNVVPGGFDGWSFSLNKTATTNPPSYTPRNPAIDPTAPTVTLAVNDLDHTITLGTSTSLTWTSTNATSITATSVTPTTGGGTWSGALAKPGGTKTITPTKKGTYTYKITATGATGSRTATAVLIVQ